MLLTKISAFPSPSKSIRNNSQKEDWYFKQSGKFSCGWKKYNTNYQYKLSVDSENDFKAVESIFNSFDTLTDFGMNEILDLLKAKPEILELNKESIINSGYIKSIQNDKKI